MGGVVIVGGGLAALRTAESLRRADYAGPITVVGSEPHEPYDRPPLSKQALADGVDIAALTYRRRAAVADVTWRLGIPAVAARLDEGVVELADGSVVTFDGLVVATGLAAARPAIDGPRTGRLALRTVDDALALRRAIRPGTRLVILGAGFVGCEVASTARAAGAEVTVVALDAEPMVRPLGPLLGAAMRRRHEDRGVRFVLGHTISSYGGADRVDSVRLSSGDEVPADVVVEAIGSIPNVGWLDGNGLDLGDGVLVDSSMTAVGPQALPVVAAGDVARHPNALFGDRARRVEHWSTPSLTGARAGASLAARLVGGEPDPAPFAAVPSFWSDQVGIQLQSFGMPELADRVAVVDGEPDSACIMEYHDERGLVGVVGIDRTADLGPWRARIAARAT